jgi:hypothetical protein
MNYDSVILELLTRVQNLEKQVEELRETSLVQAPLEENKKISTADILEYILQRKQQAKDEGKDTLRIRAGDIEKELGLKQRTPMVVSAMNKAFVEGDEYINYTPSGQSTTYEVEYKLYSKAEAQQMIIDRTFIIKRAKSPKAMAIPGSFVRIGGEYILAFDSKDRCVGVVWEHYEKRDSLANGQAEICFFNEYSNYFGKWHRMFIGGKGGQRLMYAALEHILNEKGSYTYYSELSPRR